VNELLHRRLHVDLRRTASSGCQPAKRYCASHRGDASRSVLIISLRRRIFHAKER